MSFKVLFDLIIAQKTPREGGVLFIYLKTQALFEFSKNFWSSGMR